MSMGGALGVGLRSERGWVAGIRTVNTEPIPLTDCAETFPPCASTMLRATDSPSPVPCPTSRVV